LAVWWVLSRRLWGIGLVWRRLLAVLLVLSRWWRGIGLVGWRLLPWRFVLSRRRREGLTTIRIGLSRRRGETWLALLRWLAWLARLAIGACTDRPVAPWRAALIRGWTIALTGLLLTVLSRSVWSG
jgi:hypothetical protein